MRTVTLSLQAKLDLEEIRIFYFVSRPIPEIFAILHTSRDLRETLANRAQ